MQGWTAIRECMYLTIGDSISFFSPLQRCKSGCCSKGVKQRSATRSCSGRLWLYLTSRSDEGQAAVIGRYRRLGYGDQNDESREASS